LSPRLERQAVSNHISDACCGSGSLLIEWLYGSILILDDMTKYSQLRVRVNGGTLFFT
jgi:hypothetical protein